MMRNTTTDEEALVLVINVLQQIADKALSGFRGDTDESQELSDINNLARKTVDALAKRRVS